MHSEHCFWSDAGLGRHRHRLGESLRAYGKLLEYLGVREQPEPADYADVLLEISAEAAANGHSPLDDVTYEIVMRCWEALERALSEDTDLSEQFERLRENPVVPGPRRVLARPKLLFFADRTGLAEKFGSLLDGNVILRPMGAWHAMARVGVRFLGEVTKPALVDVEEPTEDTMLTCRLDERRHLVARVVEDERAKQGRELDPSILQRLSFRYADKLSVQYTFSGFAPAHSSETEPAVAITIDGVFYSAGQDGQRAWLETARELAYAIQRAGEIGALASGLERVLAADSADEAERTLDALGYRPLAKRAQFEVPAADAIEQIGRDDQVVTGAEAAPEGGQPSAPTASSTGVQDAGATAQTPVTPASDAATLTVADAVTDILGDGQDQRTPMPPQPAERPAPPPGAPGGHPQHPGPGQGHTLRQAQRRGGAMLLSYVIPEGQISDGGDTGGGEHRSAVDRAGMDCVLQWEREHGRQPREMAHHHPGSDIESLDGEGHLVRYIEVKSLSGDWSADDPAKLTSAQFEVARQHGDRYWLYVVERALTPQRALHRIQDPAGRADRYLYDWRWAELAGEPDVTTSASGQDPEEMSHEQD